ncbi:hypothetical protein [Tsukamurella sp. PLM1]|uniref:hypothetical protein n=1 Tax=Tsukamurella sp. PLM1 TaxID=2929795 RepID=UPI00204BD532|nr:hypothetical protein MTP03_03820 [Tsukamurella sp. PLM1]
MRAREVWVHAVDLGAGARFADAPAPVLDGLLQDIVDRWRSTGEGGDIELRVDGRAPVAVDPATDPRHRVPVAGDRAAVTRWAAGRGTVGLAEAPLDGPRAGSDAAALNATRPPRHGHARPRRGGRRLFRACRR